MRFRLVRVALCVIPTLAAVPTIACHKPAAKPAAAASAPGSPASAAAAMELFRALKLQAGIQNTAAAMIDSEISHNPGLTPYREVMVEWLRKYMTWDAMAPELTKMYTETFTETELKEIAVFYASPAGQKAMEKLPELMQKTAMVGAKLGQPHTDELKAAMNARSEQLKKEQAAAGAAGAPPQGRPRPRQPAGAPAKP